MGRIKKGWLVAHTVANKYERDLLVNCDSSMTMSTDVAANITEVNTLMDRRVGSVKYTQIPCNVGAKGPY